MRQIFAMKCQGLAAQPGKDLVGVQLEEIAVVRAHVGDVDLAKTGLGVRLECLEVCVDGLAAGRRVAPYDRGRSVPSGTSPAPPPCDARRSRSVPWSWHRRAHWSGRA